MRRGEAAPASYLRGLGRSEAAGSNPGWRQLRWGQPGGRRRRRPGCRLMCGALLPCPGLGVEASLLWAAAERTLPLGVQGTPRLSEDAGGGSCQSLAFTLPVKSRAGGVPARLMRESPERSAGGLGHFQQRKLVGADVKGSDNHEGLFFFNIYGLFWVAFWALSWQAALVHVFRLFSVAMND